VQLVISGYLFLLMWVGFEDMFLLLPAEYTGGATMALVIGLAYLLNSSIGLSVDIISMSKAYRLDAWSSISMLVINAVANFYLIRNMGIVGAAWATLISLVVVNIYRTWFLWKRYGLWPFERRTLYMITVILGIAYLVRWLPDLATPFWDLILRGLIVTVLFWPVSFALGAAPELAALVRRQWGGGWS